MKILILGGYGNFGKRIAENLSNLKDITILIAGRNLDKANLFVKELSSKSSASIKAVKIDLNSKSLLKDLKLIAPDIIVHTAGPFQDQDLLVPRACLEIGSHYIDLSDDSDYVCDIEKLSDKAKEKNLLFVTGASSVPGLSSTIIDYYKSSFSEIESIEINIAPGNKAERGLATIEGILSYLGKPFKSFKEGIWTDIYGWMDPKKKMIHPKLGYRWFANVNVPDLKLFPERYNVKNSVSFQAGLELSFLHFTMVLMAYLSKWNIIKNWKPFSHFIMKSSNIFKNLGSDSGAMNINIKGKDQEGKYRNVNWSLYAPNGIGPYIPTISAIIVVRKMISNKIERRGAIPCLNLYSLDEFKFYVDDLNLEMTEIING